MTIYICGDSTAASYTPEQAPITCWADPASFCFQIFPPLPTRIKGVSMENLWLKKVKEALEIASNRYRTQNR